MKTVVQLIGRTDRDDNISRKSKVLPGQRRNEEVPEAGGIVADPETAGKELLQTIAGNNKKEPERDGEISERL